MKKIIALLLSIFVVTLLLCGSHSSEAEAQPIMTLQCCDADNIVRCRLVNWTPLGNPCFCSGQGWGHAC